MCYIISSFSISEKEKKNDNKHSLVRQNISDGFITETDQEAALLLFTEYFFSIPLEMSQPTLKMPLHAPTSAMTIKTHLLPCDKTQEPFGEEAMVDNQRQLSVNKPPCRQLPEIYLAPVSVRLHQRFSLLHLLLAL